MKIVKKCVNKFMKAKKTKAKKVSQEVVIRVEQQSAIPTVQDFLTPMKDGKNYSVEKTPFTIKQILSLVTPTPKQFIYSRPGKGGRNFDYVDIHYIQNKLNFTFGFLWDFDVISHGREADFIWVQGKLTVKLTNGATISKTQFGRAEVKYIKGTKQMVDFGNDLKSATSDALKKCASMLGIASDVYGKSEYKFETNIDPIDNTKLPTDSKSTEKKEVILCQDCDGIISQAGADFSKRLYGKQLCRDCCKLHKPLKK